MAAATGYDGPNDEQLHAYADLSYAHQPFYGSNLVEVFAVRVPDAAASSRGNRLPPCGIVDVGGAYCSVSLVFSRIHHDDSITPQPCDWQGNLVLTGPGRAISADGPIGFSIYLHDNSQDISVEEIWNKSVHLHLETPTLDRPLLETANTPYGPVEVIYAILSQGVECKVAVRLTHCDVKDPISLFGRIVARSELFDIGCVLFYNEDVKGICARSGELTPLARHQLAVPLYKVLVIEIDLHSDCGDEIMRGTLEFHPLPEGDQTGRLISKSGTQIEVKIFITEYFR
ncbi:hypothetical protein CFC21_099611 [Triticum aestivum]|uniref:DUF6598 domain-containing protein n=2 Tax=Triticum aestivum TaxID=4565 RepID=A0A9R1N222_WHEAT|nr:60 kDa jasmonate-induced protein-like [Triticum aestivum]KAF7097825.1 hypothetical protein CFC21_099611 [Triticum aestivum]